MGNRTRVAVSFIDRAGARAALSWAGGDRLHLPGRGAAAKPCPQCWVVRLVVRPSPTGRCPQSLGAVCDSNGGRMDAHVQGFRSSPACRLQGVPIPCVK